MTMESSSFDRELVCLVFPVVGPRPPYRWVLTEAQIALWVTLFPTLDILAECRAALAWVDANPRRRKTAKGMKRFLVAWLIRAANEVRTSGPAQSSVGRADYEFRCPHTPHCGGRNACRVRTELEDARGSVVMENER